MPSWLPHILVPGLLALAFFTRLPRKWVMALSPVAFLPDLDYVSHFFVPGSHRVLTHNVWIPALLLGLAWWSWRRAGRARPFSEALLRPGAPLGFALAAYYWASHVLLDVFAGGALLFWPLLDTNFYFTYEFYVDADTGEILPPRVEGGTSEGAPALSRRYTWISFEHTAILAFLAAVGLAASVHRALRRRRTAEHEDGS